MKEYGLFNRSTRQLEYSYYYHRIKTLNPPYNDNSLYIHFEVPEGTRAEQYHIIDDYVVINDGWEDVNPDATDMKIDEAIRNAEEFGHSVMLEFKRENVKLGATQLNKSGEILGALSEKVIIPSSPTYPVNLLDTLSSGTLTAAIEVLDIIISKCSTGDYVNLEVWINEERMSRYKQMLVDYLEK